MFTSNVSLFFLLGIYVQNTNAYHVQSQQCNKRRNAEAVHEPTLAKRPRGRPPGKKNKVQGIIGFIKNKVDLFGLYLY